MKTPSVLDRFGNPIQRKVLVQEAAGPTVTGVRQLFDEFIAPGLNPAKLSRILRDAAQGEMHDFLTLAEEMEERETQYSSVLSTRKRALTGLEPVVIAASDEKEDVEIADAVREQLVERPEFVDFIDDLSDALGKGYSVVELIWSLSGRRWDIDRFEHRDPRMFMFDRPTRRTLRLRVDGEPDGRELPSYKFVVHIPTLKAGLPSRNGLARLAAWSFMLKSFTLKDWAAFLETHGMPLRLGKYGPAAGPQEKAVLLRAVRDLGSDAAAIIPEGMNIEFINAKVGSDRPFEGLALYLDKQLSKAIIGQTMTTDEGGSLAQAKVHEVVRIDIKRADARQTEATINRDVIRPWVDLNYGPRGRYPVIELPVTEPEDTKVLAEVLNKLVPLGLEVQMSEVRDRLGFTEPEAKAILLRAPASARQTRTPAAAKDEGGEDPADDEDPAKATNRFRLDPRACPGCGTQERALNAEEMEERDRLVETGLDEWEPVLDPIMTAIREVLDRATDYDSFLMGLDSLASTIPTEELARRLAILQMQGHGLGDIGPKVEA